MLRSRMPEMVGGSGGSSNPRQANKEDSSDSDKQRVRDWRTRQGDEPRLTNDTDDLSLGDALSEIGDERVTRYGQIAPCVLDDGRQVGRRDPAAVGRRSDARSILTNLPSVQNPSDASLRVTVGRCAFERDRLVDARLARTRYRHSLGTDWSLHKCIKVLHENQSLQAVRAFLSIFIEEFICFTPPLSRFRIAQHKHKVEYENVQVVVVV
jgi:hypothetical protein